MKALPHQPSIRFYSSKINDELFSSEKKQFDEETMQKYIEKYLEEPDKLIPLQLTNILCFVSSNSLIYNTEMKVQLQNSENEILIYFPKTFGFYISSQSNYTIFDYFHFSLIRIPFNSLSFTLSFSSFTHQHNLFPRIIEISLPRITQSQCPVSLDLHISLDGVVNKVDCFSPFRFTKKENWNRTQYSLYLSSDKNVFQSQISFQVLYSSAYSFSVCYDDGSVPFLHHENVISSDCSAPVTPPSFYHTNSERLLVPEELSPRVNDKSKYYSGYISIFKDDIKKEDKGSCLILIELENKEKIKEIVAVIKDKMKGCDLTLIIKHEEYDFVIEGYHPLLEQMVQDNIKENNIKREESITQIRAARKKEPNTNVLYFTDKQKLTKELADLVLDGCNLIYFPDALLDQQNSMNYINLLECVNIEIIHKPMLLETIQQVLEQVSWKNSIPVITRSSLVSFMPSTMLMPFIRRAIFFLAPTTELRTITVSHNKHLSHRSFIQINNSILYLFYQLKHWSIQPTNLNAKTLIRESLMSERIAKRASDPGLIVPGIRAFIPEALRVMKHSDQIVTRNKSNDSLRKIGREERMKRFQCVIQKTSEDVIGLDAIRKIDIDDRINYKYYCKIKDENNFVVPSGFKKELKKMKDLKEIKDLMKKYNEKECIDVKIVDHVIENYLLKRTQKEIKEYKSKIEFSVYSTSGMKTRMEDYYLCIKNMNKMIQKEKKELTYFGVFDGHVGTSAADYCNFKLYNEIVRSKSFPKNIENAIQDGIINVENGFKEIAMKTKVNAGTTLAIVMIYDNIIYTANVGDSEIVVCYNDGSYVVTSEKHNPSVDKEKARIESAGGKVFYNHGWRVDGLLGVSRSIGDESMKKYVICQPKIWSKAIDSSFQFIIVACDGFWNVFKYEDAINLARNYLFNYSFSKEEDKDSNGIVLPRNKGDVSRYLIDIALKRQSFDNITVTICYFN
ncbi:hypothetical protein ENUP19_0324G0015 [Entamoeba nuttalli]|uniref:Protein phosphatase domain containing protein n=2 Tax=Entamoeba nuttalli TaxID=412467 RepID=K2H2Z5_ENTNP|nr:protein phosphatase domain containing protein [Entamoeba nuttalli P19]EKE41893.1 protein phosphatase domain containing protein [Entamoeba nuttalli P19]|eukprot:XP_008855774.1 protein phosphatase domain containing protein [Entamoeba nuttalli P19]